MLYLVLVFKLFGVCFDFIIIMTSIIIIIIIIIISIIIF